ncbi:hypothetical protein RF11_02306 [Thelohanellus kitauei]|uniref:FAM50A/XAP5 C-terminal domain-containing protein n=1 Tax=Thelohanellus kitauei TaxID=669202 RepID=A0A0C2N7U2_THEKT|nr:hypothetical protein RF11_02306 [Thelohanellus kitauei]
MHQLEKTQQNPKCTKTALGGKKDSKPVLVTNDIETRINQSAVGLKTLQEIKKAHEQFLSVDLSKPKVSASKRPSTKQQPSKLSFDVDEDEFIPCKIFKNPDAEKQTMTESRDNSQHSFIRKSEWIDEVVRIKDQDIAVSYIYWNGTGFTKIHKTKKGTTIGEFLKRVWPDLHSEFSELIDASSDDLMFVKDDFILPKDYSFFDFCVGKKPDKSGGLFNFDLLINEKTKLYSEKPEVPLSKICLKSWYENNKSKFPVDKWTDYEPEFVPDTQLPPN